MQSHAMLAADSKTIEGWSEASKQLLMEHIQETIKAEQAARLLQQQHAALATQMASSMAEKGMGCPGQSGGQRPKENLGPGTKNEGVREQGNAQGTGATPPVPSSPINTTLYKELYRDQLC